MEPRVALLRLPRLIGNKDQVRALFGSQGLPANLTQVRLTVTARDTRMMTQAVAWEIVQQASSRKAMRLIYESFTPEWAAWLLEGAEKIGILNPSFYLVEGKP